MRKRTWILTVGAALAGVTAVSKPVRADILFLDINNSLAEIETLEKRARANGEKLFIVPERPRKEAEELRGLRAKSKAAWKAYDHANCFGQSLCGEKEVPPSEACQKLRSEAEAAQKVFVEKIGPEMSAASLSEAIRKIPASSSIDSVVISGEDGGHFFGVNGDLKYQDLGNAFEQNKDLLSKVQSLHLWGCYTAVPGRVEHIWKKMFPSAGLFTGYFGAGPADTSPLNQQVLDQVLAREDQYLQKQSVDHLMEFFKSIKGANDLNFAMCSRDTYIKHSKADKLSDIQLKGKECIEKFPKADYAKYECYFHANEGCENPPSNHQKSELRNVYDFVRLNELCLENEDFRKEFSDISDPDSVLRLIYFDQVWTNFVRNHRTDLQKLNTLIADIGLPEELRIKSPEKMTRHDVLAWSAGVKKALEGRDGARINYLRNYMHGFDSGFFWLSEEYIISDWLTGVSNKKRKYFEVQVECKK